MIKPESTRGLRSAPEQTAARAAYDSQVERRDGLDNIDLDKAAGVVAGVIPYLQSVGLTMATPTWLDLDATWPCPLETERRALPAAITDIGRRNEVTRAAFRGGTRRWAGRCGGQLGGHQVREPDQWIDALNEQMF